MTATVWSIKISEVENKILDDDYCSLWNFGEVQNKITNQNAYITTQEFNRLTAENFKERLKQTDLVSKNNFDNKRISFSKAFSQNI